MYIYIYTYIYIHLYTEGYTCYKTCNVICGSNSFLRITIKIYEMRNRIKLSMLNTIELCTLFIASSAAVISLTVWSRVAKL